MRHNSGHKNFVRKSDLNLRKQFPFYKIYSLFCFGDKLVSIL